MLRSFTFAFWPYQPRLLLLRPLLTSRSGICRRAFTHEARSPQVRTHTFIAQPPHLRRLALVTRASRFLARSPCLAPPSMRFLFIGSRFMLHASFPRSVALTQLRFTLLAVTSSQRDLHPQVCAHAGRTKKVPRRGHIPAPALNQGTLETIKKIATRASHTTPNPSKHPHPSRQTNRKIHALQQRLKQTP